MGWVVAVALLLMGAPMVGDAQPSTKTYRIGWLSQGNVSLGPGSGASDFQDGLHDLGYIEGQNLTIVYRPANGNVDKLPELAAELVRMRVDIIVTLGESAALAAKRATNVVPIVATEFAQDPVKAKLVESLGRPGANITGLATISDELWQKRLGLLKEVAPRVSRVAVLWNPANPGNTSCVAEIKAAASAMGIQVTLSEASDGKALERAFANIAMEPTDAVATCWDDATLAHAKSIAEFAMKRRIPTIAPLREYVHAGALISYGASLSEHRRRAAYYVDKILKGSKPANLPVERPAHFELVVNQTTANVLGLALPAGLIVLADDVLL